MALTITSPAFKPGDVIPTRYTRDGENLSPPLQWHGAPPETRSFVVLVEDSEAPSETFRHWAIYNIPAGEAGLPEGASRRRRGEAGEGATDSEMPIMMVPSRRKDMDHTTTISGSPPSTCRGWICQRRPRPRTCGPRHCLTSLPRRRWSASTSGKAGEEPKC